MLRKLRYKFVDERSALEMLGNEFGGQIDQKQDREEKAESNFNEVSGM